MSCPPLLALSAAFLAGILLAARLSLPWGVWAGLAAAAVLAGLCRRRIALLPARSGPLPLPYTLLLAALLAGGARLAATQTPAAPTELRYYNDRGSYLIEGQVISSPVNAGRSDPVQLRALKITPAEGGEAQRATGRLLALLPPGSGLRYGDRVHLTGAPQTPPDEPGFSYRDFLARQGVATLLYRPGVRILERGRGSPVLALIYGLRERGYAFLVHSIPQPEAALLAGILLGIETDMPAALEQAFQSTGASHVIAISGSNIALVVLLFTALFSRLAPRPWAPVCAIAAIAVYTLLVGAQASVVRAAIMGSMAVAGQAIGRTQAGANTLTFAGALMAAANPLILWDAGFQLSFAATLGLILYAGRLQGWLGRLLAKRLRAPAALRLARPLSEYLLFSLAAQATTLPIILYHFGRLSFSALVANPLILPAQPLIMSLGGTALLVGLALPPLGKLAAACAWPLLAYTNRVVELLARLPWSSAGVERPGLAFVLGWYGLLFLLTLPAGRLAAFRSRLSSAGGARLRAWLTSPAALLALALIAGFAWRSALSAPDGRLRMDVFNLAGGPATLIRAPHGATLLLGGADAPQELSNALGRRLPPLFARLDALLVRGAGGLPGLPDTLERFPAGQVYWPPGELPRGALRLQSTLAAQGAGFHLLQAGDVLRLDENVSLRCLAVSEGSSTLLLEYGRFRALLAGDLPPKELEAQAGRRLHGLSVAALPAGELESQAIEDWAALGPQVVIAPQQAGAAAPASWLTLPAGGSAAIITDGEKMWIETEK